MSVKICPECKFANKSRNETCAQCGFSFQPDTAYHAIPAPEQTILDKIETRSIPRCEYCFHETTRKRRYLGRKAHYCSYGCEVRGNGPQLIVLGIILPILAFVLQVLNPGSTSLALYTLMCIIVGLCGIVIGIVGVLLDLIAPKPKFGQKPNEGLDYITCPQCQHVVLNRPRCTHCGAKLE